MGTHVCLFIGQGRRMKWEGGSFKEFLCNPCLSIYRSGDRSKLPRNGGEVGSFKEFLWEPCLYL